jgi:uncharacterized protein (TIGR00661 family)
MAKLMLSLSGEGRGHATRIRALVEHFKRDHVVSILAPGDALTFLEPLYRGSDVSVIPIPGLRFHYNGARQLDGWRTAAGAIQYLRGFRPLLANLDRLIAEKQPDLVITDFEPALPRAALQRRTPFLSVSHQHFLLTYDLSSLPAWLRFHAFYMGCIVRAYHSGQRHSVVSSFFAPPLKRSCANVTQVGVMLRPAIRHATPQPGRHLVAYLRRFAGPHVLEALASSGRPVRVYGLGDQPSRGRLSFHAIDEERFAADLAGCAALIATAGNQLVGEALYLGKPCLVMPESRNFEQYINAHFLAASGAGAWVGLENLTVFHLRAFLRRLDQFNTRLERFDRHWLDGLPATARTINRFLPKRRPQAFGRPAVVPGLQPGFAS